MQQLQAIAPYVNADPKNPASVITKAIRLLNFIKNGNVSVAKATGTYDIDLKKL
jgi:hypothetical protein